MRTTWRIFLASILLMAVVGIASAQDGGAPPPSPAPAPVATPVPAVPPIPDDPSAVPEPVVTAVPDLPPIPGTPSDTPAVEPAVPASSSTPPLVQPEPPVEPVAVPAVNPPALEKLPDSVVTTKRVTKKTVKKPVEKPATEEADSAKAAGAAVGGAAVDTTGNTPPPPGAAASTAAAAKIAPQSAPATEASAVENPEGTVSKRQMGIGGWILVALGAVALFAIMTLLRHRKKRNRSQTSIVDHETLTPEHQPASLLSQELKPVLVPRP